MYSVAVTSKFKLFYDEFEEDEDPNDMLSRLEAEAKERNKTKVDKSDKKKVTKEGQKKTETKEVAANRPEKAADKKAKRPEKKDERPPRFANRQTREDGGGQRENREFAPREGSGPPRGRGGFRGDRGAFRGEKGGAYRGRGGGFRGGRDNIAPRPNGTAQDEEWTNQSGNENSGENWTQQVGESADGERRSDDRGFRGSRGGQGYGRGGNFGGFRGNRGGGYRGRGEGRGGYRNAGREFERHSGSYKTGVKPVDKRDGAGAHNWGTMKDDMDATAPETNDTSINAEWAAKESASPETAPTTDNTDDATATAGTAPDESGENAPAGTEETEPTAVQMTLDEYRAQQAKRKAELVEALKSSKADDASRKINDGQDAFKNMVRYQKERIVDDEDEEEEDEEDDDEEDPHKTNKILIDVRFADAPRRGGGRFTGERGRGGGRGAGGERGGRGGYRGGRGGFRGGFEQRGPNQFSSDRSGPQPAQIRLNDENDFPSLK